MHERELRGRQRHAGDRLSDQIAIGLRHGFRCGRQVFWLGITPDPVRRGGWCERYAAGLGRSTTGRDGR